MHMLTNGWMRTGLTLLSLGVMGCESADSSDIKTSGMHATFTAVTDGTGTEATAVLRVGGSASNTFVKLSSGDALAVAAGTETDTLTETHLGDFYSYLGSLEADDPDTLLTFSFTRAEDTSAPASTVTVPNAFSITAPLASAHISRAAALVISWDNSGTSDAMAVAVRGNCIIDHTHTLTGDTGSYTINAADIRTPEGRETDACAGTVSVTRTRAGTLDPAFGEGGKVTATQSRSVDVTIDP